jgi:hypothetical protein
VGLALLCLGIECGLGVGNFLGGGTFCMVLILVGNSSLPMVGPRFGNLGWFWDGVGNWLGFGIGGRVGTGGRLGIVHKFSWFSLGFLFLLEICWPKSSTSISCNCPFWFENAFQVFVFIRLLLIFWRNLSFGWVWWIGQWGGWVGVGPGNLLFVSGVLGIVGFKTFKIPGGRFRFSGFDTLKIGFSSEMGVFLTSRVLIFWLGGRFILRGMVS